MLADVVAIIGKSSFVEFPLQKHAHALYREFSAEKLEIFIHKILIFFLSLL